MRAGVFLLSALVACVATVSDAALLGWRHSFNGPLSQQIWVDFYGHDHETMPTVAQWDFIARNYAIVSLEKCFAHRAFPWTNDAVHAGAAALKAINPDVKVLFYQNSLINFMSCYADGAEFAHRPDWWLKDDSGNPYKLHGDNHTRMYDLRLEAVRDFVARASVAVANASTLLDGIFADKASDIHMADMSDARWHELMAWHHVSLNHTRQAVRAAMAPVLRRTPRRILPTRRSRARARLSLRDGCARTAMSTSRSKRRPGKRTFLPCPARRKAKARGRFLKVGPKSKREPSRPRSDPPRSSVSAQRVCPPSNLQCGGQ